MWQEPKLNWVKNDPINIEDYNRIKNNLAELREMAIRLYPEFSITVNPDKARSDYHMQMRLTSWRRIWKRSVAIHIRSRQARSGRITIINHISTGRNLTAWNRPAS